MLGNIRKHLARFSVIALLLIGGVAAPATSASAATISGYCHHGIRNLPGFLNEEIFAAHYRAGNDHIHHYIHVDWLNRKHNHYVVCGSYRSGKLVHYVRT